MRHLLPSTPVTAVVVTLAALAVGVVVGCSATSAEGYNDADVTFASEMVPHHEQAVEMVKMTRGRTLDPAVQALADQIGSEQGDEIETMTGWLDDWDKPDPDRDPASAMDMGGEMEGMMSDSQMADLDAASDADFQRDWLELRIQHHQGAIEMARTEASTGRFPAAVDLAEDISTGQAAEITRMRELLSAP